MPPQTHSKLLLILQRLRGLRETQHRLAFALLTVAVALASAAVAQWISGTAALLPFALAAIGCTLLWRLGSGMVAAVASAFALDVFFLKATSGSYLGIPAWRAAGTLLLLVILTESAARLLRCRLRRDAKPPLGVHGSLDGITPDGDVYGWAFDADHPESPVRVTLAADHREAVEVAAIYPRPDVAVSMECSGQYGFYIGLDRYLPAASEALIEVRLPGGALLPGSPQRLRVPEPMHPPQRRTVLFMHIPKTAGTAFREAILANYRQSEIGYLYPTADGFLVNDLQRLPLEQRRQLRMIVGHLQYGMHEGLPQPAEYITIVREPAARVLSHYAYLLQVQPERAADEQGRVMTLAELYERRPSVDLDNSLLRHIAGVDEREFPPGTLNEDLLKRAVLHLQAGFAFVGHQENSDQAYAELRARYAWDAVEKLLPVNEGKLRAKVRPDPALLDAIRHYNRWDYLLYAEVLRLFPRSS